MNTPQFDILAQVLRDINEQTRALKSLGLDSQTLAAIKSASSIGDQLKNAFPATNSLASLVQEQQAFHNSFRSALNGIGGPTGLQVVLDSVRRAGAGFEGLKLELGALASIGVHSQAIVERIAVSDLFAGMKYEGLAAFARPQHDVFERISAAANRIDSLSNVSSFTRIGEAINAAANALSGAILPSLDYRPVIDPFFGDWSRINSLPDSYGADQYSRLHVLREIYADEAFLELNLDEGAALLSEATFGVSGTPIVLLGEPIGLVVTQDPSDLTTNLIRRVENAIRNRISQVLSNRHGKDWASKLMPDRAERWKEKQSEDAAHGLAVHDLIHYSEFT